MMLVDLLLGSVVWFVLGFFVMHVLDANCEYTFSRYCRDRFRLSTHATLWALILLWPIGVAGFVWWLFRKP